MTSWKSYSPVCCTSSMQINFLHYACSDANVIGKFRLAGCTNCGVKGFPSPSHNYIPSPSSKGQKGERDLDTEVYFPCLPGHQIVGMKVRVVAPSKWNSIWRFAPQISRRPQRLWKLSVTHCNEPGAGRHLPVWGETAGGQPLYCRTCHRTTGPLFPFFT